MEKDVNRAPVVTLTDVVYNYREYDDKGEEKITNRGVNGVSLSIYKGEFLALVGRNGSGKSTLAKMLNGLLLAQKGKVDVYGLDPTVEKELYQIRARVGMVFQNPDNQTVASIVEDDVAFGPENLGIPQKELRERVDTALADVNMLEYATKTPSRLSGGQKQRVAIAGVLAMKPKCIVLDEPTAMLDPQGRADIMRILHELHEKQHITIILITHHMDEAVQAQRVAVLDGGHLVMDGTPREIFTQTKRLRALGLEAPQSIELLERINQTAGEQIPMDALTVTECADRLEAWLKGGAQK